MATLNKIDKNLFRLTWEDPHKGVQVKRLLKMNEIDANRRFRAVRTMIDAHKLGLPLERDIRSDYTVGELENDFIAFISTEVKVGNLSKKTLMTYKLAFKKLFEVYRPHHKVNFLDVDKLKSKWAESGYAKRTQNTYLAMLSSAQTYAFDRHKITGEKLKIKKHRIEYRAPRILTDQEITKILVSSKNPEVSDVLKFYILTGARKIEILKENFRWDDVNFDNGMISMRRKGNKKQWTKVSDQVIDILFRSLKAGREIPFTRSESWIYKNCCIQIRKSSGVHFTIHDLRRAAGALLLRSGYSIYHVSKYLGHSSVLVTERYYVDLLQSDYKDMHLAVSNRLDKIMEEEKREVKFAFHEDQR